MSPLRLQGSTSGYSQIDAPAVAGDQTFTLPGTGGTLTTAEGGQTIAFGAGSASTPSITTTGDSNTGVFFPAADTIAFAEGGAEAARIDSSGRLLVGTSSAFDSAAVGTDYSIGIERANYVGFSLKSNIANGTPSYLVFNKSRGTTLNSKTVVANGDALGEIVFAGADGTNMIAAAAIKAEVDGTPGANDMPGRIVLSTTADGASSPTERLRIKNNGLHYFRSDSTSTIIAGTSSGSGATPYTFVGRYSATDIETGTDSFRVSAGGTIYAVNTTVQSIASERRLKENIAPIDPAVAWNTIKNVPYYSYNFIGVDPAQVNYGPMADEVPDEMRIETDQTDDVGIIHSYNNSMLQARLYVALQTALNKIETLEAKVAALEGASPNP